LGNWDQTEKDLVRMLVSEHLTGSRAVIKIKYGWDSWSFRVMCQSGNGTYVEKHYINALQSSLFTITSLSTSSVWITLGVGLDIIINHILLYNHCKFCCFSSFPIFKLFTFQLKHFQHCKFGSEENFWSKQKEKNHTYNSIKLQTVHYQNFPVSILHILEITK